MLRPYMYREICFYKISINYLISSVVNLSITVVLRSNRYVRKA